MDGSASARRVLEETALRVAQIQRAVGVTPTLATVLVGDDPASAAYVRMKRKRCAELGMESRNTALSGDTPTNEAVAVVAALGADPAVHGILVQHPLPAGMDRARVFETIAAAKDVDGVTSASLGRLILGLGGPAPCTPAGMMHLLREYAVALDGVHAVVLGRSPIVGRPMASMLINAHATVTLCHSRTRDLPSLVRQADVVIAAVGRPRFVRGEWIKPGAVVVDAGYNAGNVGDVDFDTALERASLITPVPGGVGPMTIAILLRQTVDAAAQQLGLQV